VAANIAAIGILKTLADEAREATAAERPPW
jgi:hypothetical protein